MNRTRRRLAKARRRLRGRKRVRVDDAFLRAVEDAFARAIMGEQARYLTVDWRKLIGEPPPPPWLGKLVVVNVEEGES